MSQIKSWISALRPRTLFLAWAATICGNSIAYSTNTFSLKICVLTILTATLLQLLSNFANDLGDYQHGTDITGNRAGPTRSVQSGVITPSQMIWAIRIAATLSALCGIFLIIEALSFINIIPIIVFSILGLCAIVAAVKYTAGKNPYGYRGLGDVFAFLFFGPVAVVGTYFLHFHEMSFRPWLPAIGVGLFTAAVLSINNMRDMENDRVSGKITLAIKLGLAGSKLYHTFLTFGGILCFFSYSIIYSENLQEYFYMVFFIPFVWILFKLYATKDNKQFDPYLKYTSISTFLLALAFAVCISI